MITYDDDTVKKASALKDIVREGSDVVKKVLTEKQVSIGYEDINKKLSFYNIKEEKHKRQTNKGNE